MGKIPKQVHKYFSIIYNFTNKKGLEKVALNRKKQFKKVLE